MTINYLCMIRRGCMFTAADSGKSDIGNYRVFTRFIDKDGVEVCGDFSRGNVYDFSRKTPKLVNEWALATDLQHEDFRGCWQYRPAVDNRGYSYTKSDILAFVNKIANNNFDEIKWIEQIEVIIDKGANFTPAGLIRDWAKRNRINYENTRYGDTVLKLYTGNYKYMSYQIEDIPHDHSKEKVIITLEEA